MFYVPQARGRMEMPQGIQRQQMGVAQQSMAQSPMNATYQTPQQSQNPMSSIGDVSTAYSTGKNAIGGVNKISNLYDSLTMNPGVNSAGNMSAMYSPTAANASFLGSGSAGAAALPQSANAAFLGAPVESSMLAAPETVAAPWMSGVGMAGEGAATGATGATTGASLMGGEAAAGAGMLGGEAAAAEGVGALGAEAAGLGVLGPVGILAGAGLLGTKLAGLW